MKAQLVYPEKIQAERISFLIKRGIDPKVAAVDLEMVKMKMAEPEEELSWNHAQIDDAEIEYKRYLTLCMRYPYPAHSIVPNKIMDETWHYHIMDTRAYHKDCERVFGHYFHHYPYFGLRGAEDEKNLEAAFIKTQEYYEKEFGEPMARGGASDCWHDCQNRCWHACSSDGGDDDDD